MSKFKTSVAILGGDVSTALTSKAIDIRNDYGLAYVATLTGAPSGDVLLQASLDNVTWITIDTNTISGTTTIFNNKDALHWGYVRFFKAAGGTGTLTVTVNIKGP